MQQLGARQRGRLARPQRRLRAGLVQLLCALGGLVLGLLLPRVSFESTVVSTRVTDALVAVGFGVLGLVSVIFSLLFLVVQWAFGSLSPRLNLFRDDPIVWRTFGFAVGVFVYSVTATLAIGDRQKVSVIVPAAEVVAVLAAVALIRTLQVKAFESIQLAPTLAAIAGEGRSIIDDLYRRPYMPGGRPSVSLPPLRRTVAWSRRQATLQQLDLRRLLRGAGSAVIVLRSCIGDTLDTIESLLGPLVSRDLDLAEVRDSSGAVRVVLSFPTWDDYLRTALDDLIESSARSPMVLLRVRALLTSLLSAAPPQRRSSIAWRLEHAEGLAAANFPLIWRDATGGEAT